MASLATRRTNGTARREAREGPPRDIAEARNPATHPAGRGPPRHAGSGNAFSRSWWKPPLARQAPRPDRVRMAGASGSTPMSHPRAASGSAPGIPATTPARCPRDRFTPSDVPALRRSAPAAGHDARRRTCGPVLPEATRPGSGGNGPVCRHPCRRPCRPGRPCRAAGVAGDPKLGCRPWTVRPRSGTGNAPRWRRGARDAPSVTGSAPACRRHRVRPLCAPGCCPWHGAGSPAAGQARQGAVLVRDKIPSLNFGQGAGVGSVVRHLRMQPARLSATLKARHLVTSVDA